jgi:serine/threonine-protein kinase
MDAWRILEAFEPCLSDLKSPPPGLEELEESQRSPFLARDGPAQQGVRHPGQEKVALKLIRADIASVPETIERFSNELKLARGIRHKDVCGMFDLGEADGAHFITMEYVHGEDLESMVRMTGVLGIGTVPSLGRQICDDLVEAHNSGVVHRDLKPQNIMVDTGGNAKIMDGGTGKSHGGF